jgi:hypothetical protein
MLLLFTGEQRQTDNTQGQNCSQQRLIATTAYGTTDVVRRV